MNNQNSALTLVATDQVEAVPQKISFTQDAKHDSKSDKFVPIRPEWGKEILAEYGYFLKSLHTGRARKLENVAHQTTIATYQNETQLKVGDIFPRITLKVPHIYGAIEAFSAFLRLSCLNGNAFRLVGSDKNKIKHLGDATSQFETVVKLLASQTEAMNDSIRAMQAKNVTPSQVAEFVREVATLRIGTGENIKNVQFQDLLKVRRATDSGQDAFTTYQVVQENLMRFGIRYQTETIDNVGNTNLRQMVARPITRTRAGEIETVRSVDLNASLYESALKILMGA